MFADNPALSRSMAIALLIAVTAGIWFGMAMPIIDERHAQKAEIESLNRLIQSFESRRENIAELKSRLTALRTDPTSVGAYFTARNETLAVAKLQSRIKTLTEAAGARLTSTQAVTRDGDKDGPQRITVRASMVGTLAAVLSIFHTLESGQPFIFLDDVSISAPRVQNVRRHGRVTRQSTGLLTVRYSAYGYLWQRSKP